MGQAQQHPKARRFHRSGDTHEHRSRHPWARQIGLRGKERQKRLRPIHDSQLILPATGLEPIQSTTSDPPTRAVVGAWRAGLLESRTASNALASLCVEVDRLMDCGTGPLLPPINQSKYICKAAREELALLRFHPASCLFCTLHCTSSASSDFMIRHQRRTPTPTTHQQRRLLELFGEEPRPRLDPTPPTCVHCSATPLARRRGLCRGGLVRPTRP